MICYICKKELVLNRYDDDGFWTERRLRVKPGTVFALSGNDKMYIAGNRCVHLDAPDGTWIEVSENTLKEHFNKCMVPAASDFSELGEAMQKLGSALKEAVEQICETIWGLSKSIVGCVDNCLKMMSYPNRRVIHLALYHRRKRIRKKNLKRIMKYFERKESRYEQKRTYKV